MAAVKTPNTPSGGASEWLLELSIGAAVLLLGIGVWFYTQHNSAPVVQERPRPVWLGVSKVIAQMSDGRMVNVRVNLDLDGEDAVKELEPHTPAFKALIQEVGTSTSHDDLRQRDGINRFGAAIRVSMNDYLEEQQTNGRVKTVAFQELTLLP